jgi:hypothetical protein
VGLQEFHLCFEILVVFYQSYVGAICAIGWTWIFHICRMHLLGWSATVVQLFPLIPDYLIICSQQSLRPRTLFLEDPRSQNGQYQWAIAPGVWCWTHSNRFPA